MKKIALVTGGSRGIGKETARHLASLGYRIAITYKNQESLASQLVKELNFDGGLNCIAIKCDVRDYDQCRDAVSTVNKIMGEISLLVNNAGVASIGLFMDMSPLEWRRVIDTNLSGAVYMSQSVISNMLSLGGGNIINLSSVWGVYGASCEVGYSASKSGLIGLTKSLALELGASNIRVNCISAGVIDTDMNAQLSATDKTALIEATPLRRLGNTAEIANTIGFLASDNASFITGQNIEVSGGFKG